MSKPIGSLRAEDIKLAIISLERSGETPSVKRIREVLGRGSLSTISKYFKKYSEDKDHYFNDTKIECMEKLQSDISDIVNCLNDYKTAMFFSAEHPQVVALICSRLNDHLIQKILKSLPLKNQEDILIRMQKIQEVNARVLYNVLCNLKTELSVFSEVEPMISVKISDQTINRIKYKLKEA